MAETKAASSSPVAAGGGGGAAASPVAASSSSSSTAAVAAAVTVAAIETKVSSKAIRIHKTGGLEVLREDTIALGTPGPNEILIQVAYAGINFIDTYQRSGLYPVPLPFTLGREGSGIVRAIGSEIKDYSVGSRVVWFGPGSYAEYALVDVLKSQVAIVPAAVSLKDAAAIWLQGLTAHYLAVSTYPIKSGDTVLVHAGAGGTGGLLIQIAKLKGATVITTTSSEEKAKVTRALGADHTILYTQTDFHARVLEITGGKGVHCVYDSVGASTWQKSLACLRPLGMLVLFGNSSGPVPAVDPSLLMRGGSLFLTRPTLGNYIDTPDALNARAADLWAWVAAGQLELRVARSFPLREAAAATAFLEGRSALGKVLLTINDGLPTAAAATATPDSATPTTTKSTSRL